MRKNEVRKKKLDYPDETNGTRWAAEARRMASKLTPEQEAEHFARAMVKITELNDGKILAQASLAQIPLLVTSDKHLLDIREDELLLAFSDADLPPVHPAHPKRLMKAVR
jgi:predicted nucleic acid-binding protein